MAERLIVAIGATGNQGGAVVRSLIQEGGWRVRGVSRDPNKPEARLLTDMGVEMVKADLEDRVSLERIFDGAYGVYSVQNYWQLGYDAEVRQGKNVAEAARTARIDHFIYSSVGGAERDTRLAHFDSKWEVEKHIASLGLPATIVRPVFFMDNFRAEPLRSAILDGKLPMALRPETKLQMVAVEDIGNVVAHCFGLPQQLIGESIEIAGDELTMPETAAVFSRVMGRTVEFAPMSIEQVRTSGMPNADEYAEMLVWFDKAGYQADIPSLRAMVPQLMNFEAWVRKTGWAEAAKERLTGARR